MGGTRTNGGSKKVEGMNVQEGTASSSSCSEQLLPSSLPMESESKPAEKEAPEEDSSDHFDDDSPPSCNFCTFAVTGPHPSWQPILICHDCVNENEDQEAPLCICQACAERCHGGDDHDVEYIGIGPSYCDCDCIGNCSIFHNSRIEADRLGISSFVAEESATDVNDEKQPNEGENVMWDVYSIPSLHDSSAASTLVEHAQELVKYSKETHWLDKNSNLEELCPLEQLAWKLMQCHSIHYGSTLRQDAMENGGAEWWVQVKDTSGENTAIDLHYDKDEALAESFGTVKACISRLLYPSSMNCTRANTMSFFLFLFLLAMTKALGSFPTFSTVTYLTPSSTNANPTIVFDHTYNQAEDEVMHSMLVSRPKVGKHLVFDGALLHGAPAHELLKDKTAIEDDAAPSASTRVTFLVNIWKDRRPANVHPLDAEIREKLLCFLSSSPPISLEESLVMTKGSIASTSLEKEEDIPEELRHRIELPFVTKGITWADQLQVSQEDEDDDDEGGLIVVTFPPPNSDHDTMLVTFGAGLQAYMDYESKDSDNEDGNKKEHESGYV
eukprot:scaffold3621_cov114-Cylindrotheca_fusiformis.AAC.6